MYSKIKLFSVLSFLLILFTGCATTSQPSYQESLNARPTPQTKQDKQKECSFLRQEIARMQSLQQQGAIQMKICNPQYGLCMGRLIMAKAVRNIASLESRASQIQCGAAFSSTVVSSNKSSISECIEACKKNTNRTSTQCFDRCNK